MQDVFRVKDKIRCSAFVFALSSEVWVLNAGRVRALKRDSHLKGHLGDAQHGPLDISLGLPGRLLGGARVGPHETLAVKGDTEALVRVRVRVRFQVRVRAIGLELGIGIGLRFGLC